MTSMFGALWTGLQSIGWLLYLLHQLISDMFNVNYRLVSALGHLIAGIVKVLYMLLSVVSLALYDAITYVLLTLSGIILFTVDCIGFIVHCCTLLFKIVYYIVAGLANGVFFVVLTPLCACQTIHSWVIWIFNTKRWLNAGAWCLQTCSNALALVWENLWNLILYLATVISCWMSTIATFAYEHMLLFCSATYSGFLSLTTVSAEAMMSVFFTFWSFIALLPNFVFNHCLMLPVNPVHGLLDLCSISCLCITLISLMVLITIGIMFNHNRPTRLIPSFLRYSTAEVIHINLDDVIDVSDDEQDYFQGRAPAMFALAGNNEDNEEDEDTDADESNMAESSDGESNDTDIVTDSDVDDSEISDAETIDVQLPDQLNTAFLGGRHHGYATRSKANVDLLQQRLDQERERSLCVICQDQVKSVLVLPCRHMCMCVDCARTVVRGTHNQRRICPLCRGNIRVVMNVYT